MGNFEIFSCFFDHIIYISKIDIFLNITLKVINSFKSYTNKQAFCRWLKGDEIES